MPRRATRPFANQAASAVESQRREIANLFSSEPISSTESSIGDDAPPPAAPAPQYTPPKMPSASQDNDSESPYSPPMSSLLLPDMPQTAKLMILTGYITSMFKQAGQRGSLPTDEEQHEMQKTLLKSNSSREEMGAVFYHATNIAHKAHNAFKAGLDEISASDEASSIKDVQLSVDAKHFKGGLPFAITSWKDVDADKLSSLDLHRGVLQAYSAVAEIKIALREIFRRQAVARAQAEEGTRADGEMELDEVEEGDGETSSVQAEAGSVESKDDDRMEVDSAYEA